MDIQKINRRHFVETDLYYRKWEKNYNATAAEIAHAWKTSHAELSHALGCKVFIIDLKKDNNKTILIQSGITPGYDAYKGILFRKN